MNKPINRISREELEVFRDNMEHAAPSDIDEYQRIATQSAIYPGQGTPFGLMYAALGLAEAGEVQNKTKKAFRDDGVYSPLMEHEQEQFPTEIQRASGMVKLHVYVEYPMPPERRSQMIKELGGLLWYIAATCNEIGANMSEVALVNLEELCSRGERGKLSGDGDNR